MIYLCINFHLNNSSGSSNGIMPEGGEHIHITEPYLFILKG
jgi:hypothetical protein